jgi:TDG/mug DNA glycosylase family protein
MHRAGFVPRAVGAFEERLLLDRGYGITNIVDRATAAAEELEPRELVEGARRLVRKVRRLRPRAIAFLGVSAYRLAFGRRAAPMGPQPERIGTTEVWILPNPSGLNAHYQIPDLVRLYAGLLRAAGGGDPCPSSSKAPRGSNRRAASRRSSTSTSAG